MKKQRFFIPLIFAITLLVGISVPSFHTYTHWKEQLAHKICSHESVGKANITHQHKTPEHCLVCTFSFGTFIETPLLTFQTQQHFSAIPYRFVVKNSPTSFSGSLYAYRGPPETWV